MKKKFIYGSVAALTMIAMVNEAEAAHTNVLLPGNEISTPYNTIPFSKVTAADYEEAIKAGIAEQNQEIAAIVNQRSMPTFENTIVAYDRSGRLLGKAVLGLSNIEHASGDTAMMNAMERVTPLLSEHSSNIVLNERLWQRIKDVYDNADKDESLTTEDRRLIDKVYRSFANSGANLTGEDREKFRKLSAELSALQVKFSQNVSNDMKNPARRLWLQAEDLAGIPESVRESYREAAKEALAAEGKADDGSYMVSVFAPAYIPFMKYSDRRDLREKLYKLYNSRNTSGEYDNRPVLIDIANVRLEIAKLMGKKNFAEYAIQEKMAKTPENVMAFLEDLRNNYNEPMKAELAEIQDFARMTSADPTFNLEAWDYSYWSEKLKADKYAFNDEDMKPYFELNNTIDGVFGLATKLYGYKFKEVNNIEGYHQDVRVYEVLDAKGKILGILYADFFYREGKNPGAWMTEFRAETKDDEGNRELPLISIVCNFSKPVGNSPVLLTPYEVETFLHEFGHALHGLSSQAKYESLSGTNVVHDFVELFSQFNENYLTEKEYLDGFARHYKTGKKMPQELIDKFIRSSQFGAAYACMRQLGFGYLDMAYYTQTEPMRATADIYAFESNAQKPVKIFDAVEGCITSPSFGHIFSGGYAAGYYGYKWSEALDADAFAAFKETGIFNKKTAAKFHKMLESGDTEDAMTLYKEFRGKEPSNDALMIRDGIKK